MTSLSPNDETSNADLEPRRLLEGGGSELERSLLASARLDRVPSDAKSRAFASLEGVLEFSSPRATPAAAGERAMSSEALARLGTPWRSGMLGLGVAGAIVASIWLRSPAGNDAPVALRSPPTTAFDEATQPVRAVAPPPALPSAQSLAEPTPPIRSNAANERTPASDPRREISARAASTNAAVPAGGLLAEVRALDHARATLAERNTERAARELAAYRKRFPKGELAIEAEVLTLELALARGERSGVETLAKRLLARPDAGRYRNRINVLLQSN